MTLQAAFGLPCKDEAPDGQDRPPSIMLSPTELDTTTVVEKNQQCTCKDCGKVFNSVWYLKQHAVKHSNDRPFKCKFCYKTYKFRSNLYQHKCPDRIKPLNGKRSRPLKQPPRDSPSAHSTSSGGASTPNSAPPGSFFDTQHRLAEEASPRRRSDSLDDRLAQPMFNQRFVDAYVQRHRHRLHQCRKCKLLFPTREYLSRHTASHAYIEARVHICLHCSQTFESERDYAKHKQFHVPQSPHTCRRCGGSFRSALALRRHFDQSRPCMCDDMLGLGEPLNQYAFIDKSDADRYETNADDPVAINGDSGLGSSSDSNHSFNPSPVNSVELGPQYHHMDFTDSSSQHPNGGATTRHTPSTSTDTRGRTDMASAASYSQQPSSGSFSALRSAQTGPMMADSLGSARSHPHDAWAEEEEDLWRSVSPLGAGVGAVDVDQTSTLLMPPMAYHQHGLQPLMGKESFYQPPRLASPQEAGVFNDFDMNCFDSLTHNNITFTSERHLGTEFIASTALEEMNAQTQLVTIVDDEGKEAKMNSLESAPPTSNAPLFSCVECNCLFNNSRQLNKHKLQHVLHNTQNQEVFQCAECWDVFYSRRELVDHKLLEHKEDRPYVCEQCGKGFRRHSNLKDHRVVHLRAPATPTKDLLHKCAFCPQQFRFRRNKKRHQKTCSACRLEHPYSLNGSDQLVFEPTGAVLEKPEPNVVAGDDMNVSVPVIIFEDDEQKQPAVLDDGQVERMGAEEERIASADANECAGEQLVPDTLIFPTLNVTVTNIDALRSGVQPRIQKCCVITSESPSVEKKEQLTASDEDVDTDGIEQDATDDNQKSKSSKRKRTFYPKPKKGTEKWRIGLGLPSSNAIGGPVCLREPCAPDESGLWPCPRCWKKFPQRNKLRLHLAFHSRASSAPAK